MSLPSSYTGPINPNPAEGEARLIIYGYVPSLPLAIVAAVTFFGNLVINGFYMIRKGRLYRSFHGLIAFGSLMECGGYAARIYSHYKPFVVVPFVVQYFLIVVAPVFFTASIYLSLSILVKGVPGTARLLILKPKVVLAIFVTFDAITTIVQIAGAALVGVAESGQARGNSVAVSVDTANNILLAGLAIQTFSFLGFLIILSVAIIRHLRIESITEGEGVKNGKIRSVLWLIMITSDLILLRTVFRLAETAQGIFGFASSHESLFGTLEYTPVILALLIWSVFPPSRFVEAANRDSISLPISSQNPQGEKKEDVEKQSRFMGNDKGNSPVTPNSPEHPVV